MLSVGLTGGIASGKSLAALFFQRLGAYLIDADEISRKVVEPGEKGWSMVVDNFGPEITGNDGSIDRARLGNIIFSNARQRELLNSLLHPLIIEETGKKLQHIAKKDTSSIVLIEMPLLIECNMQNDFDLIVLIYADRETQKKRLIERNGLKEKEAEARLNSQKNLEEKRKYASYIIDNNGSKKELEKQVKKVYGFLKQDQSEKETPG